MTRRLLAGLVSPLLLAPLLVAIALVGGSSAPAYAAACSGSTGVTVVVDFNQLGSGVQVACAASGGGKYADGLFAGSGFSLSYATQDRGFVCKVKGLPGDAPCAKASAADAYWSLWISDGSGGWSYANVGVGGLKVPDGGLVAFSWQGQKARSAPSFSATRTATPPTKAPTKPKTKAPKQPQKKAPTKQPTVPPTSSSPGATATPGAPTPGATPSAGESAAGPEGKKSRGPRGDPTGPRSGVPTSAGTPSAESSDSGPSTVPGTATDDAAQDPGDDSSQVPWWLVVAVFAGLGLAALVVTLQRRRSGP